MPSRTVRYTRYSPRQRRRRLLADRSVRFPNDVLFLDHIRQGDLEQVGRFIRTRKVSLDTIHPSGLAALHEAVLSGNLECVKLLVKYGADIHQRDETGWTPLHMACSDGYPDIARYLISLGADRDAANDDGSRAGRSAPSPGGASRGPFGPTPGSAPASRSARPPGPPPSGAAPPASAWSRALCACAGATSGRPSGGGGAAGEVRRARPAAGLGPGAGRAAGPRLLPGCSRRAPGRQRVAGAEARGGQCPRAAAPRAGADRAPGLPPAPLAPLGRWSAPGDRELRGAAAAQNCRGRNAASAPPALLVDARCHFAGQEYHLVPRPRLVAARGAVEARSGPRTHSRRFRRCLAQDASEALGPVEQAASADAPRSLRWTARASRGRGMPWASGLSEGQDPALGCRQALRHAAGGWGQPQHLGSPSC
ncbi:hypothetical protein GHT09_017495 [Marmota monax]|uniref:Protein phosphatase 1 regulatory subunit 27 n=1 Tax=Marmota monax TaxID=9995 RepID=A0A834UV69_MARMO|nr:hypothetical protein GHT09_017495 [Marmota monax]